VPTLRTPRLLLRRWRETDVVPLAAINADPEVMRWIGTGATRNLQQTRAGVEALEREWAETGIGLFAVEVLASRELAGFAGLAVPRFLPEIRPAVEIAWRLGKALWGQGIATEAAGAVLAFGLTARGLERLVAIVQIGNTASERVMQKIGMRLESETVDPYSGRPVRIYEITRSGHRAHAAAARG
jgi:RimJ/RimL family protein N-acetyltransferase